MCRFPLALALGLSLALAGPIPVPAPVETLPAPEYHPHSFELLANSRYSAHSGFTDKLPRQVLANVLWAMSRAPRAAGGWRDFYVATRENVYRYEPASRTLSVHRPGDRRYNSGSAFEVGVAALRHEEVGMAVQAGLLAGAAFRSLPGASEAVQHPEGSVVSCPMKWAADYADAHWDLPVPIQMVVVFGRADAGPLDTLGVALSSDSSLPTPHVVGPDRFEAVVAELNQDSVLSPVRLSLETVSQLCWAGYGVTPHLSFNGRQGTTVPTAAAGYNLTGRIYVVSEDGVDRYHNRLPPGTDLATRDHRLERLLTGDRRTELRQTGAGIPAGAPVYFVVCVSDTGSYQALQEAGFTGFQLLAQARALGLSGFLSLPLNRKERRSISSALGLPDEHHPALVFACGEPANGRPENESGLVTIVRAQPAIRRGRLRIEYLLSRAGEVRVEVFDMLGRPVRLLLNEQQSSGYHSAVWDGSGEDGVRLKRGTYLVVVISRGAVAKHKVTLG